MSEKPRLFALLVGINNYAHIRRLTACEKDVDRMKDFLAKYVSSTMDFHPRVLLTSEASKAEIVSAFEEHLIRGDEKEPEKRIQKNDVVLFYFSGHGALEKANRVFWRSEPNQYLETLACYDSDLDTGKNFLADKELRYLISRAAQSGAEVITIFDCCHSGDNTRAPLPARAIERLAGEIPERHWDDFIFAKQGITAEKIEQEGLETALPQGTHIQLAACNSHESAFEEEYIGGVFTSALLNALDKSRGDISYLELKHRTRNAVRSQYAQTPQLYTHTTKFKKTLGVNDSYKKMPFKTFLGGAIREKPIYSEVYYNRKARRWELDKGAVYGVDEKWEGQVQQVAVTIAPNETILANIKSVYPGFSEIEFEPYADVSTNERYEAFVPSLLFKTLKVAIRGEENGVAHFHKYAPSAALKSKGLELLDVADPLLEYSVLARDNQYLITLPNSEVPLTATVQGYANVSELLDKLRHIRRWEFAKNLQNDSTSNQLQSTALRFELKWKGQEILPDAEGHYYLDFDDSSVTKPSTTLAISLTNTLKGPLFIGGIYLSVDFGLSSKDLWPGNDTVKMLNANCTHSTVFTDVGLEPFVVKNNWPDEVVYFKIIAAVSEFDLDLMEQEALDIPPEIERGDKGLKKSNSHLEPNPQDWYTWLFPFHLVNPNHQA